MESFARLRPSAKTLLLSLAIIMPLLGISRVAKSFKDPWIYKKDFLSGYLLAKALQTGVDPYLPIPELTQRWMPEHNVTGLRHPTPHTIAMGWLCYPFAWLPYEKAVWLWFGCELLFLALAMKLLFDGLGWTLTPRHWLLAFWLALGWMPIVEDLWYGQFSLILLVLWLCTWRALRANQDVWGGVCLGAMMTLKLIGWPLVLWLAWQRRWRGVFAAALAAGSLHVAAIALHGWPMVRDYYFKYGPMISAMYRVGDLNFSLMTFGRRLFSAFGVNYTITPLWESPLLAQLAGSTLPLLALVLALYGAQRLKRFDAGFALLMSVSLILNPIAWTHYLMGLCLAFALFAERMEQLGWPRARLWQFVVCALPVFLPTSTWSGLVLAFTGNVFNTQRPVVPFWAGLLSAIPTFAVLGICWLFWRVEQEEKQPATAIAALHVGELTPSHG